MHLRLNLRPAQRKYGIVITLLLCVAMVCVAFSGSDREGFDASRREVLLRRVGHELLLRSGDSVSRVLPVRKTAAHEYQVSFENPFSFEPDSLVQTTTRLMEADPQAGNYVVQVLNASDASVVYGYAVSSNRKNDIIACLGRMQPKGRYVISIKFEPQRSTSALLGYGLGGIALLGFLGFAFFKPAQPGPVQIQNTSDRSYEEQGLSQATYSDKFTLGLISFDVGARKLIIDGVTTELTKTECRILRVFALKPNAIIERSRLQKEIWEDEGVIVGRSLDMFISKLRKKLEPDPSVKITVVRGKGYKLETGNSVV